MLAILSYSHLLASIAGLGAVAVAWQATDAALEGRWRGSGVLSLTAVALGAVAVALAC